MLELWIRSPGNQGTRLKQKALEYLPIWKSSIASTVIGITTRPWLPGLCYPFIG